MEEFLKNSHKLVVLGIGNDMRGDDALGSFLAKKLSNLLKYNQDVIVYDAGTVPENFTGAIKKENPSHIILIDAVDMKERPGFIRLIAKDEIANYSISTHALPISFLIRYMESTGTAQTLLLGIQPGNMDLSNEISIEVENSINYLLKLFDRLIKSSQL
ncbi:MAG: hydrogenase maturation peptidase HycI [Methanobacteriaceae archaeon]